MSSRIPQNELEARQARNATMHRRRLAGETLAAIAADYGIGPERVRQICSLLDSCATPVYVELEGLRYRVYDSRIVRPHVTRYADPPASWATSRVFRPREGWWRIHTFERGESRAIDEATLLRQLRGAGYLARERFDSASIGPAHGTCS